MPICSPDKFWRAGVCRHLASHGFSVIEEFVPERGLRVDVMALGPKGEIWVVECKSSRADFSRIRNGRAIWTGVTGISGRSIWLPSELLPAESGLIIADGYDAEIVRMAPEDKLAGARRNALIRKFATHAARRLHALRDPEAQLSRLGLGAFEWVTCGPA